MSCSVFSNSLGESSKKGEIGPFEIIDEVKKIAKEKYPESVFLIVRSANRNFQYLRTTTGSIIDFSYIKPTGKTTNWDYYFAKDKEAFIQKDEFLARPKSYDVDKENLFGIRYANGTYYYIDSSAFWSDASILGKNSDLDTKNLLNPSQIISSVKSELKTIHGDDQIKTIAFALKNYAYAYPPKTSWRKQKGMIGPVWEASAILTDNKRGLTVFIDAKDGKVVEESRGIVLTK